MAASRKAGRGVAADAGRIGIGRLRIGRLGIAAAAALALLHAAAGAAFAGPLEPDDGVWAAQPHAAEIFALSLPALGSGAYAVEHRLGRPGRRDTIRIGDLSGGTAFLAMAVTRSDDTASLVATARRLLGEGAAPSPWPARMPSKFGAMDAVDVAAGGRLCLAFAYRNAGARLTIDGAYCAPPEAVADRRLVACLVDRLDILGGADPALRAVFVAAEKHRDFCGAGNPLGTGGRPLWYEAGNDPPKLRLRTLR